MNFYSVAGAALLAICGIALSYKMNKRASSALGQIDAVISFFLYLRSQIECFALPVDDIISSCDRKLLSECGCESADGIRELRGLFESFFMLDGESERLIFSFAEGFGGSYLEEQVKECDYYIELLRIRRAEVAGELPKKRKVNSALCISGALALIILLL